MPILKTVVHFFRPNVYNISTFDNEQLPAKCLQKVIFDCFHNRARLCDGAVRKSRKFERNFCNLL